jgi:hypothetical protein
MDITQDIKPINIAQLETEIRVTFPTRYHGLSTDQTHIRLFVDDDFSEADVEILKALYAAHTPVETDAAATARKQKTVEDAIKALQAIDFDAIDSFAKVKNVLRLMRFIVVRD